MLLAASAIYILVQLASLTYMCRNKRQDSESIYGNAIWFGGTEAYKHMDESGQLEYNNFAAYIRDSDIGVQILGVQITYQLAFDIGTKTLIYIPVALEILAKFWH